MPMSVLENDSVAKICALSKSVLADLRPRLSSINELYNSAGGIKETLTQEELDEVTALSGLTKTTLDDTVFAFSAMLSAIDAAQAAINQTAARFL
jgi:hypothetical protein